MQFEFTPEQFEALRRCFEVGAPAPGNFDPTNEPVSPAVVEKVRGRLVEAEAARTPDAEKIVVTLDTPDERFALGGCFEVGGEGADTISDELWQQITHVLWPVTCNPHATLA